ncbi:Pleckstrin domain superfamily protein isoform 2 [Hibiscus syriacus]|uniref:Pleckstrin domain superfamily protein isoform 2 n=1 Tax=Hibiscus syriacus TaxID=106335 RepID=A0A6A2YJX6_HIBSY|nr:Pleckstrin domain superfamily protein isoform 2 [Hibiscus syriacus]
MAGSPFDAQRAEPFQQQPNATPPLDPRGLSCLGSMSKLSIPNLQGPVCTTGFCFEKFSDVVDWLKANAVNVNNLSAAETHKDDSKMAPETKNPENIVFHGKTGFTATSTTGFVPGSTTMSFSPGSTAGTFSLDTSTTRPTPADMTKKFPPEGTTTSFTSASSTTSFTSAGLTTSSMEAGSKSSFTFGLATANYASPVQQIALLHQALRLLGALEYSLIANLLSCLVGVASTFYRTQTSVSVDNNAADDADDDNELPKPSSPSVKKSEEKGVVVVHEVKCKLYVKSTDPADKDSWKDKGTGQLSIKCKEGISKGSKDSKPTIVVRNDVGKVLLNALLYHGIKTSAQKNSLVAIFHTSDEGGNNEDVVARTFLIRTKSEDDRNKLQQRSKSMLLHRKPGCLPPPIALDPSLIPSAARSEGTLLQKFV